MTTQSKDLVALTWAQRAQAELGAEMRFRQLIFGLNRIVGVPATILAMAESAREDEERHSMLCSAVARQYGHPTGFAMLEGLVHEYEPKWNLLSEYADRLMSEIVLMCCITETINASLLHTISASLNAASQTGRIMKSILADEVKHSQLGWAYLASESAKRSCNFLSPFLPQMLDISVRDELFLPTQTSDSSEDCLRHGVLPVSQRLEQFEATMGSVVLPGLAQFEIDVAPAKEWLAKKLEGSRDTIRHTGLAFD